MAAPSSRPTLLAVSLAALLLTVGCISAGDGPSQDANGTEPLTPAGATDGTTLVVEVVDPFHAPIPDADVTVAAGASPRSATTGLDGLARFEGLAPGSARVEARAPDFRPRSLELALEAQGEQRTTMVLAPLGDAGTFVQTFEFEGFFECSATALIVTGDCFATARAVVDEAGVPVGENATNERFVFPFPLEPGWSKLRLTQTWDDPAAGLGTMMRLNLEPADANATEGHGERYARVEGAAPLVLELVPGQGHELASSEELVLPAEGAEVRTRSFHLGLSEAHNPGGTEFLGMGLALQQRFTVVMEVIYGQAPAPMDG